MWRLKKDGEWVGVKWPEYVDAWMSLLRCQGQSVSHAVEYEAGRSSGARRSSGRGCVVVIRTISTGSEGDVDIDTDTRYRVKDKPGVAWWIDKVCDYHYPPACVTAVMVGDDHRWHIDLEDLVAIDDDEYCGGCGQIGCGHG
jgi:hypothetical protein